MALVASAFTFGLNAFGQARAGASTVNSANFVSEVGDFIGQGSTYNFSTVTYTGLRGGYPTFSVSNATDQFDVWIAAPAGQALTPGTYSDAERFDFRSAGFPGLDVFGDGRGCNVVEGSFTIYDATYDSNGNVLSFSAQFFQHCEGFYPALMGNIAYNTNTLPPPLPASAPEPPSSAQVSSQTGDWVGQGQQYSFPIAHPDTFNYYTGSGALRFDLDDSSNIDFYVTFDAPGGSGLGVGTYSGAQRYPFESAGSPGLDVSGEGRGCNTESGSFTIYAISYDTFGVLKSFAAEFIDHCEGAVPALFGLIRYNSDVPMPPLPVPATPTPPVITNMPSSGVVGSGFVAAVSTSSDGRTSVVSHSTNVCTVGGDGLSVSYVGIGTCTLTPEVAASLDYRAGEGEEQSVPVTQAIVTAPSSSSPHGYWLVGSDGGIFSFGSAQFFGSMGGQRLQRPVVGIVPTVDRGGYWLDASDGGVFSFGDTRFYGSIPGLGIHPAGSGVPDSLDAPIVGMVPSHDQAGYFMVASDGGVFAFGDATFAGSCPGIGGCTGTAVAVVPDSTGKGYWLVTATGNVYTFGDAPYLGAPGPQSSHFTSAVATPDGKGYWLLTADGEVFAYGDAAPHGSPSPGAFNSLDPANAIFATSDGGGYWVADALGRVFAFGSAPSEGDMSGTHLIGPIIGASGS